jgi:tetratricopeptide (TPR) repeat protein
MIRLTKSGIIGLAGIFLAIWLIAGCGPPQQVPGSAVKVAKVDTEYVYEANVARYLDDYRLARRTRISTFIGFSPDEILIAREHAIDSEIRKEIKRMPGVNIDSREVRALADEQAEELANRVHEMLTEEGADFAALALEYSSGITSTTGGQLQPFGEVENPEPYQALAYQMEVGEISEPIESPDGWRIIRLDEVTDDPLSGKLYTISMILLTPDVQKAEDTIVDRIGEEHTIEILDPKYNSRRALIAGYNDLALSMAEEAISRSDEDDLAHYLRARALWALDRKDEAIQELDKAAEVGSITDGLIPYYYYYAGQYYEEMEQPEDALAAYHQSYDNWRQNINLAFSLRDAFERLGDDEYATIMQGEIDDIAAQDSIVLTFGGRSGTGGVITTDQGRYEGTSALYEPGYRE